MLRQGTSGDTIVPLLEGYAIKLELVTNLKRHATNILAELRDIKEAIFISEHSKRLVYMADIHDLEFTQRKLALLD